MAKDVLITCKNIFKNNDKKKLKFEFNKKWIELINHLEMVKGKGKISSK